MNYVTNLSIAINSHKVPDGEYEGFWSGYDVTFYIEAEIVYGTAVQGTRGLNIPCIVTAKDGCLTIKEDIK